MLARVPWVKPAPVKKPVRPRKLNRDRRRNLVETTAAILKQGEPTKFTFEATCRHRIRSGLCLKGWGWQEADSAAKDVVDTALNMIGAQRPTWKQGQPEWTQEGFAPIERHNCQQCRKPLPEGHKVFCSSNCASAFRMQKHRDNNREAYNAMIRAYRKKKAALLPLRKCEECSRDFQPTRETSRFCSIGCRNRRNGNLRRYRA